MQKLVTFVFATFITVSIYAQNWKVDQSHSSVSFSVSHLMISEVDGKFNSFEGNVSSTKNDFSGANISFTIDVSSIDTDNEQRDGHLKSEDFFYTEKHSQITFKSSSFKKRKGNNYTLKGILTMRGVSKKVSFDVIFKGTAKDGYGNTRAGFLIKGILNRIDYGVAWNAKTEQGSLTVGEDVNLAIKLELIKQK